MISEFFSVECVCVLQVEESKTVRTHGFTQLYFLPEEFAWFREWLQLRERTLPTSGYFLNTAGIEGLTLHCVVIRLPMLECEPRAV